MAASGISLNVNDISAGIGVNLSLNVTQLSLDFTDPNSKGISGSADYSANIGPLDYTQKQYVDDKDALKADLISGKVPFSQLPEYIAWPGVGQIVKSGKGYTIDLEGYVILNTGPMSLNEKGDFFRGITETGKYIPYMRYKGTGDVNNFENHSYEIEINALLPDEAGYIAQEE